MFNATTYDPARQTRQTTAPAVKWLDGEWRGKSDFYKCGMREEFVERKSLYSDYLILKRSHVIIIIM